MRNHGKTESSMCRYYLKISAVVLLECCSVFAVFWVLSGICFGLLNVETGFNCNWQKYLTDLSYVFVLYNDWWSILLKSLRHIVSDKMLFIPFGALTGTLITALIMLLRHDWVVRLRYLWHFHFAKLKDIKLMGVLKNSGIVLGYFDKMMIRAKRNQASLCIGEMGSGKTSSVAVPTVLIADDQSVIAVDLTGILPQYTAEYRAKIGEVVCFNWDKLDDDSGKVFYARWNPLIAPHLPDNREDRDNYIKRLTAYFVYKDVEARQNYWNMAIHNLLAAFFNYWIVKIEQAQANDYFVEKLANGETLNKEDKDLLLSYYIKMPKSLTGEVLEALDGNQFGIDDYLPIGSWGGVTEAWQGRDLCFAMITDWLIYNYTNSVDNNGEDWKHWLKSLIDESLLFAYGNNVIDDFERVLHLSAQQRAFVLARAVKALMIFVDDAIRERTDGNDIDFADLRGVYDNTDGRVKPLTVYCLANRVYSKIINQIFVDEMLHYTTRVDDVNRGLPILTIIDDIGHYPRLHNLMDILKNGEQQRISLLMLSNSLSLLANVYGKKDLESIIIYTDYKIIKAQSNRHLSQQIDKLASFATKSVEIPQKNYQLRVKNYADANCFHKLAQDFRLCRNIKSNAKFFQVVLIRGFYSCPIVADDVVISEDEKFAARAVCSAGWGLPWQKVVQKPESALCTPKADYWDDLRGQDS